MTFRSKTKSRVNRLVNHRQIQLILLRNPRPVMNTCTTQRINAETELRAANDLQIGNEKSGQPSRQPPSNSTDIAPQSATSNEHLHHPADQRRDGASRRE